ncbi:hypothetical protein AB0L13_35670 [Saccharopolyspora shandongensis]|uniref:hypothetical protein n=1 Tax=Saccharopolyspora shandongensis TaxID=418495 RepID=UPI00344857A9
MPDHELDLLFSHELDEAGGVRRRRCQLLHQSALPAAQRLGVDDGDAHVQQRAEHANPASNPSSRIRSLPIVFFALNPIRPPSWPALRWKFSAIIVRHIG